MQFTIEYPLRSDVDGGAWIKPANVVRFVQTLEKAGLDGLGFTDHPAPSRKWLEGGGHESFDPYAALCFCAAATTRLRLMTRLAVVPYRNPLLQARSMMTLDVLSGGRATFVLGVGYLRSEFAALGVDFEERNALFDEAIEVIKGVFREETFAYKGRHFTAPGQCMVPTVVQKPHPPLWLGGNSKRSMERIARWGQGWSVLFGAAQVAQTSRTPPITNEAELAAALKVLEARLAEHGRKLSDIDIDVGSQAGDMTNGLSDQERIDRLAGLKSLGVTWTGLHVPTDDVEAACDAVLRFGETIAARVR
jgi:probable F420-dependent oxidoreductase